MIFCGALCALLEYFREKKSSPVSRELICSETLFAKLSLSDIMKDGECDEERQISIQGILNSQEALIQKKCKNINIFNFM